MKSRNFPRRTFAKARRFAVSAFGGPASPAAAITQPGSAAAAERPTRSASCSSEHGALDADQRGLHPPRSTNPVFLRGGPAERQQRPVRLPPSRASFRTMAWTSSSPSQPRPRRPRRGRRATSPSWAPPSPTMPSRSRRVERCPRRQPHRSLTSTRSPTRSPFCSSLCRRRAGGHPVLHRRGATPEIQD